MPMSDNHPTAIIEPGAKLGKNVTIEPYAIIKGTVTLGDNVTVKSHALGQKHKLKNSTERRPM